MSDKKRIDGMIDKAAKSDKADRTAASGDPRTRTTCWNRLKLIATTGI